MMVAERRARVHGADGGQAAHRLSRPGPARSCSNLHAPASVGRENRRYWERRIPMSIRDPIQWCPPGCRCVTAQVRGTHREMTVTPEAWTVLGTGIVILAAIATSTHQIHGETREIGSEIGQLRERMAKLEGLLEGPREAISGRKAARAAHDGGNAATSRARVLTRRASHAFARTELCHDCVVANEGGSS